MGCDIHLRAEYYAPLETVRLVDGDLKIVPSTPENMQEVDANLNVVAATAMAWQHGERLTPKKDIRFNSYYVERLNEPSVKEEWDKMPALELDYEDRFYRGRNYMLFCRLAGVRGDPSDAVWDERGFPDDASDHVANEFFEGWGGYSGDAHTPSHQTLAELLEQDWKDLLTEQDGGFWSGDWLQTLDRLKALADEKCGGDQTHVRIVYWFDN